MVPLRPIDAYGHVATPRFFTHDEFGRVMEENGVERALLSTAQFSPDLLELSRAAVKHPERFRVLGLPIGPDHAWTHACVRAQLEAGFVGLRVQGRTILDDPALLDLLAEHRAILLAVSFEPWTPIAGLLVDWLDRNPACLVLGGHFAGPADPALLDRDAGLRKLFGHPRFAVVFSRQGLMDEATLVPWAAAVIDRVGWDRVLWGSEWPVAMWRDEGYAGTQNFVDRFGPTDSQRAAFLRHNAERLIFARPALTPQLLDAAWDAMPHRAPSDIHLFPRGMHLDESEHLRLARAYLAEPAAERGRYSDFVRQVIARGLAAA